MTVVPGAPIPVVVASTRRSACPPAGVSVVDETLAASSTALAASRPPAWLLSRTKPRPRLRQGAVAGSPRCGRSPERVLAVGGAAPALSTSTHQVVLMQ